MVYEMCVTNNFHFLALGGLTRGTKFTKIGDDLLPTQVYHPAKFHRPASTYAGDIRYKTSVEKQTKKQTNNKRCIPTWDDCVGHIKNYLTMTMMTMNE